MNGTQVLIAAGYGALFVCSIFVAVFLIRSTGRRKLGRPDQGTLIERENKVALGVVAALVALLVATLFAIPYGDTSAEGAQVVEVESFQFGWSIEPDVLRADEPVEFRLVSRDVAHGFGVYQDSKLLEQVQVQGRNPNAASEFGDEQRLVMTFEDPGVYTVNCLEFCGVLHHEMVADFEVVE